VDLILMDSSDYLLDPMRTIAVPIEPKEGEEAQADDEPDIELKVVGVPAPGIYSPQGRERLDAVFNWFVSAGQTYRILAYMPRVGEGQRDWFRELLAQLRLKYDAPCVVIIDLERFTPDLLMFLFFNGFRSVILEDRGTLSDEALDAKLEIIREHTRAISHDEHGKPRLIRPGEQMLWALWTHTGPGMHHYARLQLLQKSGVTWQMVSPTQFNVGGEETEPHQGDTPKSLPCVLYDNSITVDSNGDILACPRFARAGGTVVGNLFRDSVEETLLNRGRRSLAVGCTEHCITCAAAGRFFWHVDTNDIVKEYYAIGRREGNAPPVAVTAGPAEGTQFDLGAADTARQEEELAAFEKSLESWAASMEEPPAEKKPE